MSSPELGLGVDLAGGPELHAVDPGMLLGRRRQAPPDNLVLVELHECERQMVSSDHTTRTNPHDNGAYE